jgi:hypothetical protein
MKWLIVRMGSSFLTVDSEKGNALSEQISTSRQTLSRRAREFVPSSGTPLDQGFAARLTLDPRIPAERITLGSSVADKPDDLAT